MKYNISKWIKSTNKQQELFFYRIDSEDAFNGQVATVTQNKNITYICSDDINLTEMWTASSVVKGNKYGNVQTTVSGTRIKYYDYQHFETLIEALFWCDLNLMDAGLKLSDPFEYKEIISSGI